MVTALRNGVYRVEFDHVKASGCVHRGRLCGCAKLSDDVRGDHVHAARALPAYDRGLFLEALRPHVAVLHQPAHATGWWQMEVVSIQGDVGSADDADATLTLRCDALDGTTFVVSADKLHEVRPGLLCAGGQLSHHPSITAAMDNCLHQLREDIKTTEARTRKTASEKVKRLLLG